MKHTFLLLIIVFSMNNILAQDFESMKKVQLKEKTDYKKAESQVEEACNYLLSCPINEHPANRNSAIKLVMKWIEGTPDYTFEIDTKVVKLTNDNPDLFGLYLVAITKAVLSNPNDKLSNDQIYNLAVDYLADYCSNKSNNLKPSKVLKKAIKEKA